MHDFSTSTTEQILFTHAAGAADGAVRCVCRGNVASARYPADQVHCFMDGGPHARRPGRSVLHRRCLVFSACPNHGEPDHPGSIDNAGGQRDLPSDTQSDVPGLCTFIAGTRHVFGQVIRIAPCAAVHDLPSALPDTPRGKSAAGAIWCFVRGLLPAGATLAIEGFKPARPGPRRLVLTAHLAPMLATDRSAGAHRPDVHLPTCPPAHLPTCPPAQLILCPTITSK